MELELKKLTKEFQGFKAVDDITLTMKSGGEVVDTVKSYFGKNNADENALHTY